MILLAGGLILLTSLLITAILHPQTKPAWVVSFYIFSYANIVLAGEIANTVGLLNQAWAFTSLHALFAGVAGIIWWRAGKPSLAGPFNLRVRDSKELKILGFLKRWPDIVLLGFGVSAALILAAVLIIVVPPNNNDSLYVHLSRVGHWLQNGSFFPYPTAQTIQLYYPVDHPMQLLWLILFTGRDHLAGFAQWIAILATMAGIFGLARLLGFTRPSSVFAALLYASYPIVLLQSTTTQNDMIFAAFLVSTVYFLFLGIQQNHRNMLAVSAISLSLGLGSKQVFYYYIPAMLFLLLILIWKFRSWIIPHITYWAISSLAAFILLAAYINMVNLNFFGNPFGPRELVSDYTGTESFSTTLQSIPYNIPRLVYQAIDTAGLPFPLDVYAHRVKEVTFRFLAQITQFSIEGTQYTFGGHGFDLATMNENQEDHAWFGPVSVLILFPAIFHQLIIGIRKRDSFRIGISLVPIIFLITFAFFFPHWDPYMGRYFTPAAAIATPMIAGFISSTRWNQIVRYCTVGLALMVMTVTMLYNPAKPIAGARTKVFNIWLDDRITLITIQGRSYYDMAMMVERNVPPDAIIGTYSPRYMLEYPLFGEQLTRQLIPIFPVENITDVNWLKDNGIEYVLLQTWDDVRPGTPKELIVIDKVLNWELLTWR